MAQVLTIFIFTLTLFANENPFNVKKSMFDLKYENVIKQTYEESCGASSLATLMNLYGVDIDEKELLKEFNSTNMVTFKDIANVAINHNFKAKAYKIDIKTFEKLNIPVIARILRHKDYPHFVVVKNLNGDFILSLDPNSGKTLLSKRDFFDIWFKYGGGFILIAMPNNDREVKEIETINFNELLKL